MVTAKLDRSGLLRKIAAIRRASPAALEAFDKTVADRVMSDVILNSPKDTRRYVAAFAQAANAAGLGPFAVPALRPGKFAAQALPRLQAQLGKWQMIVDRYERQGRTDKWYSRAVRARDRAKEELHKWRPDAVIIFGGKGRRLKVTVRNKVYGGTGTKVTGQGSVKFVLHNREPHASIVESRSRVLRASLAWAKAFGFRIGGRAYTRRITQAAGRGSLFASR